MSLARDMTERKRAEETLRGERRFRTLAEALPNMVTAEPDGATDYCQRPHHRVHRPHPGAAPGLGLAIDHPPRRSAPVPRAVDPLDRDRRALRDRVPAAPRRRCLPLAPRRALALRDDSGRITKWFGSCIDINDQKRAEEALRQAKEAAEAANRAKDEFLANVSHEIRTPMNAILGMTELALDTPLTEDQRQCLKTVKSAADNLLGLINDLLDFSKIEAGKLSWTRPTSRCGRRSVTPCGPWPCGPTRKGWS